MLDIDRLVDMLRDTRKDLLIARFSEDTEENRELIKKLEEDKAFFEEEISR